MTSVYEKDALLKEEIIRIQKSLDLSAFAETFSFEAFKPFLDKGYITDAIDERVYSRRLDGYLIMTKYLIAEESQVEK